MLRQLVKHTHIHQAAQALERGGIIAYPTEAVFGLGALPFDESAVLKILSIKKRPVDKGVILISDCWENAFDFIDLEKFTLPPETDNPTTWLVPSSEQTPVWVKGEHPKVAIRVTKHPIVKALCARLGSAIVSTSANVAAHTPTRDAFSTRLVFKDAVDYYLPGEVNKEAPVSTIVDMETGAVLR